MKLITSNGTLNFQEILTKISAAKTVFVATYNLDSNENNPLLNELRKMPAGTTATIVTNVPNRRLAKPFESKAGPDGEVEKYLQFLDAEKFKCTLDSWFCFANHAKIIICDDIAYVGSANLSWGSQKNFEAGYLVDHADDVDELLQFADEILNEAVPYLNIQGRRDQRILLEFRSALPDIRDAIERVSCDWVEDVSGNGELVVDPDSIAVPAAIAAEIKRATFAGERLRRRVEDHKSAAEFGEMVISLSEALSELNALVEIIIKGQAVPPILHEQTLSEKLVEEYINILSNNGNVGEVQSHPTFQEELNSQLEANLTERTTVAGKLFSRLSQLLDEVPAKITALLLEVKVNEKLKRIETRFKSG